MFCSHSISDLCHEAYSLLCVPVTPSAAEQCRSFQFGQADLQLHLCLHWASQIFEQCDMISLVVRQSSVILYSIFASAESVASTEACRPHPEPHEVYWGIRNGRG